MKLERILLLLCVVYLSTIPAHAQGIVDFGRVEIGQDSIIQVGYLSALANSITIDNPYPPFYLVSYAHDTTGGWNYQFQFMFQPDHVGEFSSTPVRTFDANGNLLCCLILQGEGLNAADVNDPFILHPSSFILSSFPNPFNPTTTISFTLPQAGEVNLRVSDILGREVTMLKHGFMSIGEHRVTFDGSELSSGIYFVRLQAGQRETTQKLVLMK